MRLAFAQTLGIVYRLGRANFIMGFGWMQAWLYVLTLVVRPVTQVLFFGVMASFVTRGGDVTFWLVGNSLQVCVLTSLYEVADTLVSERNAGTLPLLIMAPLDKFLVFAGRSWLVGLHGVLVSAVALTVSSLCFGVDFGATLWGALLLAVFSSVLAVSAFGAALGSVALLTTDINFIGNVAAGLMLLLSGVNFPVTDLPFGLRWLSGVLPLTRGAQAARLAIAGRGTEAFALSMSELGLAAAWLLVGYLLFRWLETRARREASLDLY